MRMLSMLPRIAAVAALAVVSVPSRAPAAEAGLVLDEVKLKGLDGKPAPLLGDGGATVVVFFRAAQERSVETLEMVKGAQEVLKGKRVRWVGLVPGDSAPAEIRSAVAAGGAELPVLVDAGDALYAKLQIRMHPAIAIVDGARRLTALEPFHPIGYSDVVCARVRRALGEISDADVEKALAPPASQLPGDDVVGVARRHVSLGRKLLLAKSFGAAHENARKSLEIAPTAAGWRLEGDIFVAEGKCGEAVKSFDAALALDPNDGVARSGRDRCAK